MTFRLNSLFCLLLFPCFIGVSSVASLLRVCGVSVAAEPAAQPVTLTEDAASLTLANSHVTAHIEKRTGGLTSLRFQGVETLDAASGKAGGYWSFDGGGSLGASGEARIILNPAKNGGERTSSPAASRPAAALAGWPSMSICVSN